MDSYPSGTEGQINSFFYKFPWSWCDSKVIQEKIEGRRIKICRVSCSVLWKPFIILWSNYGLIMHRERGSWNTGEAQSHYVVISFRQKPVLLERQGDRFTRSAPRLGKQRQSQILLHSQAVFSSDQLLCLVITLERAHWYEAAIESGTPDPLSDPQ